MRTVEVESHTFLCLEGEAGADGHKGDTGATGSLGDKGARGPRGPVGAPGSIGLSGLQGPMGPGISHLLKGRKQCSSEAEGDNRVAVPVSHLLAILVLNAYLGQVY